MKSNSKNKRIGKTKMNPVYMIEKKITLITSIFKYRKNKETCYHYHVLLPGYHYFVHAYVPLLYGIIFFRYLVSHRQVFLR